MAVSNVCAVQILENDSLPNQNNLSLCVVAALIEKYESE